MQNPYEPDEPINPKAEDALKILNGLINGEDSAAVKEMIAKKFPDIHIPEVKLKKDFEDKVTKIQDDFDKKLQEKDNEFKNFQLEQLRKEKINSMPRYGLAEKDYPAVEKLMTEGKVVDFDTAVNYYKMERQLVPPQNAEPAPPPPDEDLVNIKSTLRGNFNKNAFTQKLHEIVDRKMAQGEL